MAEPFDPYDDSDCSVCGGPGPSDWIVSYLGTPGSFGRCERCHDREAMPAYYFEAMVIGNHHAVRGFASEAFGPLWRDVTVYDDGEYVPARPLLERLADVGAFTPYPPEA